MEAKEETHLSEAQSPPNMISEVLPKSGLVYSEKGSLSEILCKPKIMPIKSASLQRMEEKLRQARAQPDDEGAAEDEVVHK